MKKYLVGIRRYDAEIEGFLNDGAAQGYELHSLTPRTNGDRMSEVVIVMIKSG